MPISIIYLFHKFPIYFANKCLCCPLATKCSRILRTLPSINLRITLARDVDDLEKIGSGWFHAIPSIMCKAQSAKADGVDIRQCASATGLFPTTTGTASMPAKHCCMLGDNFREQESPGFQLHQASRPLCNFVLRGRVAVI